MTTPNFLSRTLARAKAAGAYIRSNWEAWCAAALTAALAGFELFSDYLPLIAGALGGWPLVLVVSVVSFAVATLRTKKKAEARKLRKKRSPAGAGKESK